MKSARAMKKAVGVLEPFIEAEKEAMEAAGVTEDAEARTGLGRALVARREYEAGLEELLEAVRLDPTGVGVEAKQAMLDAFDALGLEDAIANDYRFKLSLLLFS